jgi:hypothetical protein
MSADLFGGLDRAIEALDSYAERQLSARDPSEGTKLLDRIDAELVACAKAERAGTISSEVLRETIDRVRARAEELAPRLSDLWSEAASREVSEDSPAPDWIEPIASLSPSRRALRVATGRSSDRARLLAAARRALARPRGEVIRLFSELRQGAPEGLRLAADDRADEAPDPGKTGSVVFDEEGIEVRVFDFFVSGGSLVGIRIRLSPNVAGDLASEGAVRVRLVSDRGEDLVEPVRSLRQPLLFWGAFAGGDRFRIELPDLSLSFDLTVARPRG